VNQQRRPRPTRGAPYESIEDVRVEFDSERSWSDSDLGPGETDHRSNGGIETGCLVQEVTVNGSKLADETIR
jgi:hypothetical protein